MPSPIPVETGIDLAKGFLGGLRQWRLGRRRVRVLAKELRCIYADRRRPQITSLVDKLVYAELHEVAAMGSDLDRRFEELQGVLREFATAMKRMEPSAEISLPSVEQLFLGLRDVVRAHGKAFTPQEMIETLDRLHEPHWLKEERDSWWTRTRRRARRALPLMPVTKEDSHS